MNCIINNFHNPINISTEVDNKNKVNLKKNFVSVKKEINNGIKIIEENINNEVSSKALNTMKEDIKLFYKVRNFLENPYTKNSFKIVGVDNRLKIYNYSDSYSFEVEYEKQKIFTMLFNQTQQKKNYYIELTSFFHEYYF